MAKIRLDIVTAERLVFSDDVDWVTAPGAEGELTILPRHAPLLTYLQPGDLHLRRDGEEMDIAVSGGFLEVEPNRVTVLADTAERAEEIDVARAQAAADRAKALLAHREAVDQNEIRRALAELRRSQIRIKVARRRHERPTEPPRE
jgi:F-type H+-transporting ATPase subunit epsilon